MSHPASSVRVAVLAFVAAVPFARADSVTLTSSRDNTLIDMSGDVSNGQGDGIYVGATLHSGVRRALIRFDTNPIPAGATITSVSLELTLIMTQGADGPAELHRLLADWGEGASSFNGGTGAPAASGDATWLDRFFGSATLWTNPGGDFTATPSGSTTILSAASTQTFPSSPGLVADVQSWLNTPAQNFGWIITGDEANTQTSRRFASREYPTPALRPHLIVTYTPPVPACPADFNHSGVISVQDIFDFLAAYFSGNSNADVNHSGATSVQDIFDFLAMYFAGCP